VGSIVVPSTINILVKMSAVGGWAELRARVMRETRAFVVWHFEITSNCIAARGSHRLASFEEFDDTDVVLSGPGLYKVF